MPVQERKRHALRRPSTLPRRGYAHARAEALCSTLVINNSGRPHGRNNLRELPGSVFSLTTTLSLRESRARGLGTGGCTRVTPEHAPERAPPCQVPRTWSSRAPPERSLGEGKGRKVV